MNQLRRMVLVNSANVRYREVLLDGHIHFIGTQGTGKSTLLRAILFFYNADQRKLGISKEKKSFAEYYFPYADSYIFYEVQLGERRFCVWLYKRQNRLCFRFVDGGYDQTLAIEGNAARSESEVMAKAAELGFKVERAIYNLTDYRDILYGENRSMRRYALMRNAMNYSTIPRTISNIFLNANLDGDFIKKTIIDSLSDEMVEINLETNRHHLETARNHYADVMQYQRHEPLAEQIVSAYAAVHELEERQREVAWKIGAAINRARELVLVLEEQSASETGAEQTQKEKLKILREQFDTKKRRLGDRLAGFKKDIAYTNKLTQQYVDLRIEDLRKQAEKGPQFEQELTHCAEHLRVLTAKVEQQEQQFEIAGHKLKNECTERVQTMRAELHDSKDRNRAEQDAARVAYDQHERALQTDCEDNCGGYHSDKFDAERTLKELEFKLRQLDQIPFFEEERSTLEEQKTNLEQQQIRAEENQKQVKSAIEALQTEAEHRQKIAEAEGENLLRPLTEERQSHQIALAERKGELEALNGSLLEYLDDQVEGWNKNIGRVVRRDVLLESGLEPKAGEGYSFYGVDLNLEHLEAEPLSKSELAAAIESLENVLSELSKKIEVQLAENQEEQDQLIRQYNRRIREQQDQGKAVSAELFNLERDLERNAIARHGLDERCVAERTKQQTGLEKQRHKARSQLAEVDSLINGLTEKRDAALKRLKSDYGRRKNALEKSVAQNETETESKVSEQRELLAGQLDKLKAERKALLKKQGVDLQKVAALDKQKEQLQKKLEGIKLHERTLIEYEKDKREWIDKLEEFQRERGQLENKLKHQTDLFERRIRQEQALLLEILERLRGLRDDQKQVTGEIAAFESFEREELFDSFESFICHHDQGDESSCGEWIGELKNLALKFVKQFKQLTERITEFSGWFDEGNCLGFEVHLSAEASFRAFAQDLAEFVSEQKIITLKTEVTRKYSMVLEAIVTETNRLLQREGEVHRVIQKINADFRASNFVGVVHSIEMRLQESRNGIFLVLRELCKFQSENHMSFGELDLFNQGNSSNDETAVELLDQLRVRMAQTKSAKLRLEDALDLEFRVCENENDTSWVGRLANVGSNGTDVLVKSMIYINLLNIFKTGARKDAEAAMLHCLVDEVGILHDSNVLSLINFAAERGICMINGSPNSHNEQDYRHIYIFRKDEGNRTAITKLISHAS
ncbi:MAG: ATP-binding protein [Pontiella sp.]